MKIHSVASVSCVVKDSDVAVTSTDGNQFSAAGDSGSLIFNQAVGEINSTLPVVGLLYAGGTNNAGVPITIANDINAVLTALNLTTVCNGAVRALLEAIFGSSAEVVGPRRKMRRKERQLRRLRGRVLARTPLGKRVVEFVDRNAADLSGALLEDEEAFGLTVRLVEPWLRRGNNFEILESQVDAETIQTFARLAERLARIQPSLGEPIAKFSDVISKAEGQTVRALLSKGRAPRPKRKQTKATRKKR